MSFGLTAELFLATVATPCSLESGFTYAPFDPEAAVLGALSSALPFGAVCSEHRTKLRPDCTWKQRQVVDLMCPCGVIRGLSVRYARIDSGDRDYYDFKLLCGSVTPHMHPMWGGPSSLSFQEGMSPTKAKLADARSAACPSQRTVHFPPDA